MLTLFREPQAVRRPHLTLRDVNESIICRLCNGYLIDPTTINECMHSFCRSCIVQHTNARKTCPSCASPNKRVELQQLRPDHRLKALVYKLVPGLCQSEHKRQRAFNERHNIKPICAARNLTRSKSASHSVNDDLLERDNNGDWMKVVRLNADLADDEYSFWSADDPISLSLEYHPKAVSEHEADRIPSIKYLLCPAALTVHHLQRFLANKYGLSIETTIGGKIDIQIISDDEVLPKSLTLMDIAYCSKWSQIKPLQLFYQIFVNVPDTPHISQSNVSTQFPDSLDTTDSSVGIENHVRPSEAVKHNIYKSHASTHIHQTSSPSHPKNENNAKHLKNSYDFDDYDDDENSTMHFNQYSISTDKPIKPTKVTLVKNHQGTNRATCSSSTEANTFKSTKPSSQNSTVKLVAAKTTADFKSLRSNDIKYKNDVCVPKPPTKDRRKEEVTKPHHYTPAKATALGRRKSVHSVANVKSPFNDTGIKPPHVEQAQNKRPTTDKQMPSTNNNANTCSPQKTPSVVVSIPPRRRRNSMSDEHYEFFALNKLKTANKKLKTGGQKPNVKVDDSVMLKCASDAKIEKRNVPKLKIDINLNKLKTANKKLKTGGKKPNVKVDDSVKQKYGSGAKIEKRNVPKLKIDINRLPKMKNDTKSEEDVQSPPFEVITFPSTITEYAKHIGLKPVQPMCSLETPPVSADDTESTSQESKSDEISEKSLHKKRKKSNKHSKEPGSKRKKLHAEISSQQEESLKFKLKLTATNKPSKSERKLSFSCSSDDSTAILKPMLEPKISKSVVVSPMLEPKISKSVVVSPMLEPKISKSVEVIRAEVSPKPSISFANFPNLTDLPKERNFEAKLQSTSSSIVNYSDFMGPPKEAKTQNATYPSLRPKPPISSRRNSVAVARPQPHQIERPRTPDLILSKVFNRPKASNCFQTNRPWDMQRPKPSNLLPEMQITKISQNKPSSGTKLFNKPSFSSEIEIFQIPSNSKVSKSPKKSELNSQLLILPNTQSPPRVKTLHVNIEKANGVSRDGALDLSGSKQNGVQHTSTKVRPAALGSPVAFIDITTPTKSVVEPVSLHRPTPRTLDSEFNKRSSATKTNNQIDILLKPNTEAENSKAVSGKNILYSALTQNVSPNPITWITPKVPQTDSASDVLSRKVSELLLNEQRLQNLKLLSESALRREKVLMQNSSMFTTINKPRPTSMSKLNETTPASRNSAVRQQNASIRSIPNPSALAFRQYGPLPPPLVPTSPSLVKLSTAKDSKSSSSALTLKTSTSSSSPSSPLQLLQALTVATAKSTSLPHGSPTNNNTYPINNNNNHITDKSDASLMSKHQKSTSLDTNDSKLIAVKPNSHIGAKTSVTASTETVTPSSSSVDIV